MTKAPECCAYCKYSRTSGEERLECHRHAPVPRLIEGSEADMQWNWPIVEEDDWCGEFRSKEEGK